MFPKEIPRSTGLPLQFQGGCGEPVALVSDSSCTDDSGGGRSCGDVATQDLVGKILPTARAVEAELLTQWAWKAEPHAKEDYS